MLVTSRRSFLALAIACLCVPLADATEAQVAVDTPRIAVSDAWARATPPGLDLSSAYLSITNRGPRADLLLGASSPVADHVEIHRTLMEDDLSRMRPAEQLPLPPGATLRFAPTGLHLMLVGLSAPLHEGKTVPLVLRFRDAGNLTVHVHIRPLGATAAHHGH